MPNINQQTEGVLAIKKDDQLVAIVWREPKSGHQVFFKCEEMGVDEIESLLNDYKLT